MLNAPSQQNFTVLTPENVGQTLRELRLLNDKQKQHLVLHCNADPKTVTRWERTGLIKFHDLHQALNYLGYEICLRKKTS